MNKDIKISIKAARVNAELSQAELAKYIGVDKSTVFNWEHGLSEPNVTQLRMISEVSG